MSVVSIFTAECFDPFRLLNYHQASKQPLHSLVRITNLPGNMF